MSYVTDHVKAADGSYVLSVYEAGWEMCFAKLHVVLMVVGDDMSNRIRPLSHCIYLLFFCLECFSIPVEIGILGWFKSTRRCFSNKDKGSGIVMKLEVRVLILGSSELSLKMLFFWPIWRTQDYLKIYIVMQIQLL